MQACCYDCGRQYGDEHGFPDLVVPHEVWAKITPTGHEGGLLCPSCMCRRAYDAGLEHVTATFRSGPFCIPEHPPSPAAGERESEIRDLHEYLEQRDDAGTLTWEDAERMRAIRDLLALLDEARRERDALRRVIKDGVYDEHPELKADGYSAGWHAALQKMRQAVKEIAR